MKRRGLIFNSQPNKAVIVALGLMLMLCPASRTWAYANVNDSRTIAQSQKQVKGQVVDATENLLLVQVYSRRELRMG